MVDLAPAKLQLVRTIPRQRGWLYEPKFDGYRGLLMTNSAGQAAVYSRNAKNLSPYFPELVQMAKSLPPGCVLDGEIVQPIEGGVSFFQLQHRLALPIAQRPKVAAESPVAFVAFDILQDKSQDLRQLRLSQRRKRLEQLTTAAKTPMLQLIVQVDDAIAAAAWLDDSMSMRGIEGVVSKLDEAYPKATVRRWQKVRRQSTMDMLVVGFVAESGGSVRLVLARQAGADQRIVGSTLPISRDDAKTLDALIARAVPGERPLWTPFVKERIEDWYRLPRALTAEVVVTNLDGENLRQPAKFLRWRLREPA